MTPSEIARKIARKLCIEDMIHAHHRKAVAAIIEPEVREWLGVPVAWCVECFRPAPHDCLVFTDKEQAQDYATEQEEEAANEGCERTFEVCPLYALTQPKEPDYES